MKKDGERIENPWWIFNPFLFLNSTFGVFPLIRNLDGYNHILGVWEKGQKLVAKGGAAAGQNLSNEYRVVAIFDDDSKFVRAYWIATENVTEYTVESGFVLTGQDKNFFPLAKKLDPDFVDYDPNGNTVSQDRTNMFNIFKNANADYIFSVIDDKLSLVKDHEDIATAVAKSNNSQVTVKGIVRALNADGQVGFVIEDATSPVLVYSEAENLAVGDYVKVDGKIGTYQGSIQITDPTITKITDNVPTIQEGTPVQWDGTKLAEFINNAKTKNSAAQLVEVTGMLSISGKHRNLLVDHSTNQGSLKVSTQLDANLENNTPYKVTGYAANYTISGNYNYAVIYVSKIEKITETIPVESVTILGEAIQELQSGKKLNLTANVMPITAEQGITWADDGSGHATVNPETGEVTGVSAGTTIVTVTTTGKDAQSQPKTDSVTIQVSESGLQLVYTLDSTKKSGTNSNYIENCDVEIDNITWNVEGNSQEKPWRLGGKTSNTSKKDRSITSKTALVANVKEIEIEFGASDKMTINSVTLYVYKQDPISVTENNEPIATKSISYEKNSKVTVTNEDDSDWSNCYYKLTFNLSATSSSNGYVTVSTMKFYSEKA